MQLITKLFLMILMVIIINKEEYKPGYGEIIFNKAFAVKISRQQLQLQTYILHARIFCEDKFMVQIAHVTIMVQILKPFFLCYILIVWPTCIRGETKKSVVCILCITNRTTYGSYVDNVSCPSGHDQLCHSMDYLAEHSSECFSRGHTIILLQCSCVESTTVQRIGLCKIYTHSSYKVHRT